MKTVRDKHTMVSTMAPIVRDPVWIYCSSAEQDIVASAVARAFAIIREEDETILILERDHAAPLGFNISMPMRQITLQVFSALDGYGLTAAFAPPIAAAGIPCNVIAGSRANAREGDISKWHGATLLNGRYRYISPKEDYTKLAAPVD